MVNSPPHRGRSATIYWVVLASALYLALGASALCFKLNPQWFYWRAWEYFEDIVYHNKEVPPVWQGPERGDLSRRNFLYFGESHVTRVTTDQDGFRSTPALPGPYRVAFLGDSTIFGSGLSDRETLPWRLAQELGVRVFNGARQDITQVLGRKDLGQVKLVIEGRTERALVGALKEDNPRTLAYRSLREGKPTFWTAFSFNFTSSPPLPIVFWGVWVMICKIFYSSGARWPSAIWFWKSIATNTPQRT